MKKVLKWIVFAFIGLVVLTAMFGNDEEAKTSSQTETTVEKTEAGVKAEPKAKEEPKAKKTEKTYGVGDAVKTGELTYTVNGVEEKNLISNILGDKKTSGKFVIVDLKVKNGDKEERFVDAEMFKIKIGDTEYSADSELDMYVNEGGIGFFLETINPNIEKEGKVVFEVPADAKGYTLEVSSGFGWSGGEYAKIKF